MSKLSPILAPEADRAHYVAQITLSGLAVLMVGALAWAGWQGAFPGLVKAFKGETVAGTELTPPKAGKSASLPPNVLAVNSLPFPSPAVSTTEAPVTRPVAPKVEAPPRIGSTTTTSPSLANSMAGLANSSLPPPSSSGSVAAVPPGVLGSPGILGKPISNPQAREMVDAAREVRRLGDMHAALESLRAADLHEPQHPEILSEMALTYEAMQLADKAEIAWRNVLALGEAAGGGYYNLARKHLDVLQDSAKTTALNSSVKPLGLGACQVLPDKTVVKGQKITLRIPLIATQGAGTPVDPSQVDLQVYFYDKLADGSVSPTHADTHTDWVSPPVDWKDSAEELVDVTYYMPELRPDELRNLGKRSYHGYVVKLFYQNQFMGEQAEPKSLLDYKPQSPGAAGLNNALFPKN